MTAFRRKQAGVALGMAAGLALTIGAFLAPKLPRVPEDLAGRVSLWLACGLLLLIWIVIGVGRLANHRFFTADDIDGAGLSQGSGRAKLLQAQLQNTLEQVLIALFAYGTWLFLAPASSRGLVIVFTIYFAVGRMLFLAGYSRGAQFRALGFALTFYPSLALILLILPRAVAIPWRSVGGV